MLSVSNLSVQFGKRILFDEVNTTFNNGNCYGIIGANGAGKSTFLKILAGKQEPTSGHVHLEPGKRMSVLEQNHNKHDEDTVLETVLKGNKPLYKLKSEIDALYADYTDENAEKIGEGKDPWGGYRAGFAGTTTIDVGDYDFKAAWAGKIQLELLIEGIRQ